MLAGFGVRCVRSVDGNQTFVVDVNLNIVLFNKSVDRFAALADDDSDLVWVNHHGKRTRCVLGHFRTRSRNFFEHLVHDVHSALFRLSERLFEDVSGYADFRARYLEVHIAEEVFHALNIAQNREFR